MRLLRLLLIAFVNLLVVVLLLEGGAYLYLRANHAPGFRARIQQTLDAPAPAAARPTQRLPGWMRDQILHPYLGFVRDPDQARHVFNDRVVRVPVNEHGFFGPPPVTGDADDGRLVIGLFGGSVAAELYLDAREALVAGLLEARPALAGRGIEVVSVALGGMKQPQQLLALEYFLALGARFDVVVNLDGFNEVVLPMAENVPLGVSPYFPRSWRVYAMGAAGGERGRILAELRDLRVAREASRTFFSGAWQRRSNLALVLWQSSRKRADAEEARLQTELRQDFALQSAPTARERGPAFTDPQPERVYAASAALWRRASQQMAAASEANGTAYLHVLQPNQYVAGSKELTEAERRDAIAGPGYAYRTGVEAGYPLLLAEAAAIEAAGVAFADLTGVFAPEPDAIYRDTCCHYNRRGNEILARAIAEELLRRGMVPER